MNKIIQQIRKELIKNTDEATKKSFQRFFKEEVKYYGVKTAVVGKIANKFWTDVKNLSKEEIFKLCEELYSSDYTEEAFIVSFWVPKLANKFELNDLALFKEWREKYINNWAKCDGFCNHSIGLFIEKYPEIIEDLKKWAKSENRWLKRAAAVSLIIPAKEGKFLADIIEIANQLLLDKDDMVQKGYGWMLKEASRLHQKEIFDYVVKNKNIMPRTALRYAIELMPKELRAEAMKKY
jgi:3-methyladenine DNA glycosylase AlkD